MHLFDPNEMHSEKANKTLRKNATCSFEQILEGKNHKTAASQPLSSHLTYLPSKTHLENKKTNT